VKYNDSLQLKGFIPQNTGTNTIQKGNVNNNKLYQSLPSLKNSVNLLSKSFKSTIFLRRLQNKTYLTNLQDFVNEKGSQEISNIGHISQKKLSSKIDLNAENYLINFIKDYRAKRLTDIFFMTYKNMHLLNKVIKVSPNDIDQTTDK
jgi:hypothetical protein